MATRRSRLQVKPNLGGKSRSLPVRRETPQPSPRKQNVKSKEDGHLTTLQEISVPSSRVESVLPESSQLQSFTQDPEDVVHNETITELNGVDSISKGPNIAYKSLNNEIRPGGNDENEHFIGTNSSEDQDNRESISDRVNVKEKERDSLDISTTAIGLVSAGTKDHSNIDSAASQASTTSENATVGKFGMSKSTGQNDEIKNQNDVAKPKSRNRFPKPKPNLSEAGRPKARPLISKLEPSRAQTVKPVEVLQHRTEDVIRNRVITEPVQRSASVSDTEQRKEQPTPQTENIVSSKHDEVSSFADSIPVKKQSKAEIKRRKKHTIYDPCDKPPDRSKMRMCDLIYWNPSNNPMKQSSLPSSKVDTAEESSPAPQRLGAATQEENKADDPEAKEDEQEEENVAVPQVTIGPDGSIIVNEDTLVIPNPDKKLMEISDADIVNETESFVTYSTFKKKVQARVWSDKESAKFFQILSMIGTDFGLMLNLFPKRTRRELKNKFKREERQNKLLVDQAIAERRHFDISLFNQPPENEDPPIKKTKIKRRKSESVENTNNPPVSKKHKTRKKRSVNYYEDTDSEDENMEIEDQVTNRPASKPVKFVTKKIVNNLTRPATKTPNIITSTEVTNKEMDEILTELNNNPPPSPAYGQSSDHITSPFIPRICSNNPQSNENVIEDGIAMMPMSPYTSDQIHSMISPVGFLSPKPSPQIVSNNSLFLSPRIQPQQLARTKSPQSTWVHQSDTGQTPPVASLLNGSPHYVLVANSPQNKQETIIHVYMLSPTHQPESQQVMNSPNLKSSGLSLMQTDQTFIVSPSSTGQAERLKSKTATEEISSFSAIQEVTVISSNVDSLNLQTDTIVSNIGSEVTVEERNMKAVPGNT